jgi:hypothetical protein
MNASGHLSGPTHMNTLTGCKYFIFSKRMVEKTAACLAQLMKALTFSFAVFKAAGEL